MFYEVVEVVYKIWCYFGIICIFVLLFREKMWECEVESVSDFNGLL